MDKSVSEHFKLVFLCVFVLTVAAFLVAVLMSALIDHPDGDVNGVVSWAENLSKIGFGGFIGLLGGRAA